MADPRPTKVAVVDEVRERFGASEAAIVTEYRGMTVKDIADLRTALRPVGGDYKIYKNTLVRIATRDLDLTDLESMLVGPTAIAFVETDAAGVAKALRDFARGNPNLVVKGGLMGGNVLSAKDATALADLPSREVLLARFAGLLAAPMQQFAGLLQALPRNFAYGLKALVDQGGGNPSTADAETASAPSESESSSSAPEATEQATVEASEGGDESGEEALTQAADETEPGAATSTAESEASSDAPEAAEESAGDGEGEGSAEVSGGGEESGDGALTEAATESELGAATAASSETAEGEEQSADSEESNE